MGPGRAEPPEPDSMFYSLTAHELAHSWVPMIVSTDERRYGWLDEGLTSFNGIQAENDFFPGVDHSRADRDGYLEAARAGSEGEIMRWSDFHYPGRAYTAASYWKPTTLLGVLRTLLGEEVFVEAFRSFFATWAYRHPTPWDFFNTFERVSGRDLDWFWWSWYYETWVLDHAVASVTTDGTGSTITVEDRGWALMPCRLTVTRADGETLRREIPVTTWLSGRTASRLIIPAGAPIVRVEIDAEAAFPDVDRSNNVWERDTDSQSVEASPAK
jgi:aminopeptidase N